MNFAEWMVAITIFFFAIFLGTDIAEYSKLRVVAQSVANDARDVMTATGSYNTYVENYIAYRLRQEKQSLSRWDVYVDDGQYSDNSLMEIRLTTVMQPTSLKFAGQMEFWAITAYSSGFSQIKQ
ncbi:MULTISPECIES: hypothetical protein [Brevibacillus]|uniref:hypothetical protein n=1 Tax=Brevibacillus TaxID=55080 RepID=UPI0020402AB1|nr:MULTISPECIES: hypothetical protein [Brevibacillus]MCM3625624.1 hypothetical protein [Brevibacillus borstelensis]MDH4620033.1 hypothetical protein [Brevibacillus sp. AY1]